MALQKDFDRSALFVLAGGMRWRLTETPIAIVIPGRSRSEAPSPRPWNPCRYLRHGVQRSRILHRSNASKSRNGFYGLRTSLRSLLRHRMTRLGRLRPIPGVCPDFMEMTKALIFGTGIAVGGALKN
ncbi:hypothetical protein [Mesorhizobium sp. B2-6-2]|uniref:hypothetical protein n=1 Tax=Mesorhizobium sp. B2-6-2 TaxID=2589915 RepID=UPI00112D166F|nr:hypothetical protein [Mesorhizobium sp. B2-6-2]TPJ83038.1 hypothetical protein FJ419_04585 [Mesorhizobium sp. B2-6-2]